MTDQEAIEQVAGNGIRNTLLMRSNRINLWVKDQGLEALRPKLNDKYTSHVYQLGSIAKSFYAHLEEETLKAPIDVVVPHIGVLALTETEYMSIYPRYVAKEGGVIEKVVEDYLNRYPRFRVTFMHRTTGPSTALYFQFPEKTYKRLVRSMALLHPYGKYYPFREHGIVKYKRLLKEKKDEVDNS